MSEQFLPQGYDVNLTYSILVLKSFLDFGERNMTNEIEILRKSYTQNRDITLEANITEEMKDIGLNQLQNWYEEMWNLTNKDLRSKLRQSVLIQLYSFMESFLFKQCDRHKYLNKKEYSVKDLKGNTDLEKVALYYKNSVCVDIKKINEWQYIDNFRRLRNILVHKEGRLANQDDLNRMHKFSEGNFQIELIVDDLEHLIVLHDRKFIDECIDNVKAFLSQLIIAK